MGYYLLIFLASAQVMLIEIMGAKYLAPILGGSQTVWISQILITLLSLSFGAFISSKMTLKQSALFLTVSSVYFLLLNLFVSKVVAYVPLDNLLVSSLSLSLIFYLIPLLALGVLFPLISLELMKSGHALGKISFISTIGSVVGTLSTYFIVLYFTNDIILLSLAVLLLLYSCALYAYLGQKKVINAGIAVIVLSFGLSDYLQSKSSGVSTPSNIKVISSTNSHFGEITVLEQGQKVIITNDKLVQNSFDKDSKKSLSLFTYFLSDMPKLYQEKSPKTALVLGLGVGVVSKQLQDEGAEVDSVEINPAMTALSKKLLNFEGKVYEEDARTFVMRSSKKYDLIVLDAFLVDNVPKTLITLEFFNKLKQMLNDGGLISINSFGTIPLDIVSSSIIKTLDKAGFNFKVYSINQWNMFYLLGKEPLVQRRLPFFPEQPESIIPLFLKLADSEIKDYPNEGKVIYDLDSSLEVLEDISRLQYRKANKL